MIQLKHWRKRVKRPRPSYFACAIIWNRCSEFWSLKLPISLRISSIKTTTPAFIRRASGSILRKSENRAKPQSVRPAWLCWRITTSAMCANAWRAFWKTRTMLIMNWSWWTMGPQTAQGRILIPSQAPRWFTWNTICTWWRALTSVCWRPKENTVPPYAMISSSLRTGSAIYWSAWSPTPKSGMPPREPPVFLICSKSRFRSLPLSAFRKKRGNLTAAIRESGRSALFCCPTCFAAQPRCFNASGIMTPAFTGANLRTMTSAFESDGRAISLSTAGTR